MNEPEIPAENTGVKVVNQFMKCEIPVGDLLQADFD
jgi:hypothetical protein